MRLRRLCVQRHEGDTITLLTNDLRALRRRHRRLYKGRWQIELLFRWIKQHLKIRKFLGNNDNAIRLQLFAAMIAYALLRIAARTHRVTMLDPALHRSGRPMPLRTPQHRRHRQAAARQSKPATIRTSPNQMSLTYV